MTTADVINRLLSKFQQHSLKFNLVQHHIDVTIGPRNYNVHISPDQRLTVYEYHNNRVFCSQFSFWVEGILNGMQRTESGSLIEAPTP